MNKLNIFNNLKENIYDYQIILQFIPQYKELREYLKTIKIIEEQEIINFVKENYKKSIIYPKLKESLNNENDKEFIKNLIIETVLMKHYYIKESLEIIKNSAIECCDIVEYIINYPTTFPVPLEKEKNKRLEKLFEQYDIIIRYYLYDNYGTLQINSNDIVRLKNHLKECLDSINLLIEEINNKEKYLTNFIDKEAGIKILEQTKEKVKFPLSSYQEKGKSRREEGKKYIRRQFGNKII